MLAQLTSQASWFDHLLANVASQTSWFDLILAQLANQIYWFRHFLAKLPSQTDQKGSPYLRQAHQPDQLSWHLEPAALLKSSQLLQTETQNWWAKSGTYYKPLGKELGTMGHIRSHM